MADLVEDFDYAEYQYRQPEDEAERQKWQAEMLIVRAAKAGHDTPADRATWANESRDYPHQTEAILALTLALKQRLGGVVLSGPPGGGKSYLAGRAAHKLRSEEQVPTTYLKVKRLLDELVSLQIDEGISRAAIDRRRIQVGLIPALALDDLGSDRTSGFKQEQLTEILDLRFNAHVRKPLVTIVTTNLPKVLLDEYLGKRAASRFEGLCPNWIDMTGPDLRKGT